MLVTFEVLKLDTFIDVAALPLNIFVISLTFFVLNLVRLNDVALEF